MKKLLLLALTIASSFNTIGAWPSIFNRKPLTPFQAQEGTLFNFNNSQYFVIDKAVVQRPDLGEKAQEIKLCLQPKNEEITAKVVWFDQLNRVASCAETVDYNQIANTHFQRKIGESYPIAGKNMNLAEKITSEQSPNKTLIYKDSLFFGNRVFRKDFTPNAINQKWMFEPNYRRCALTGLATFGAIFGIYHYTHKK